MSKLLDQSQMEAKLDLLVLQGRYLHAAVQNTTGKDIQPPTLGDNLFDNVHVMEKYVADQELALTDKQGDQTSANQNASKLTATQRCEATLQKAEARRARTRAAIESASGTATEKCRAVNEATQTTNTQ